ncbi:MAG: DNA polymerase [Mycobacterium leprae]
MLFVAYFASAEWACFKALNWPMPSRIIDLYAEFRVQTNGYVLPLGNGLLSALQRHGIYTTTTKDEKEEIRTRVLAGPPWNPGEPKAILDYCEGDVAPLGALLEAMLPALLLPSKKAWRHALLRGRYTWSVAEMEWLGVPIDTQFHSRLLDNWDAIRRKLIRGIDQAYGVYVGTSFKAGLFADWLVRTKQRWPRLASGKLALDEDTFSAMAKVCPAVRPLKELRRELSDVRHRRIAVGRDGRNRTLLSPFATKTGRNAPRGTFIFTAGSWLRGMIKPPPGRSVAYLDFRAQEVGIAAALSNDLAMLQAYDSGDPYMRFAVLARLAPPGATKDTHGAVRDLCKVAVLGTNYGMGARTLAESTGVPRHEAEYVLSKLVTTFPVYWAWSERHIDIGYLLGRMKTRHGWQMHVTGATTPTALRNWTMQSTGADMLRFAAIRVQERGIDVCAPVHDALLIESDTADMDDVVREAKEAMEKASADVLNGFRVEVEANPTKAVVHWPNRFPPGDKGIAMWTKVNDLLEAR